MFLLTVVNFRNNIKDKKNPKVKRQGILKFEKREVSKTTFKKKKNLKCHSYDAKISLIFLKKEFL